MSKGGFDSKLVEEYFDKLWPIFRSITGNGVRETHKILSEIIPLKSLEIPSGTSAFDWEVPKEWSVREAYVIDPKGKRILDIADNNLHLVNYSIPFSGEMTLEEFNKYLHSIPELPEAIPYITSYYEHRWGFCISHRQRQELVDGIYKIHIDTDLFEGSMTISEAILPGKSDQEILFSTYTCHPSLANNELSGPLVTAFLYRALSKHKDRRFTYRFIFGPETIGSIFYLWKRRETIKKKLVAGYMVTCVGDNGKFHYKFSRSGDSVADRAVQYFFRKNRKYQCEFLPFFPWGSDERQYCSPGFNFPVGSLTRTIYGKYPEYHTSLDNKKIISFDSIIETIDVYFQICKTLEMNYKFINQKPYCEPKLDKYDLYSTFSETRKNKEWMNAVRWILNLSDGSNDLLDISEKSEIDIELLHEMALDCQSKKLLKLSEGID